MLKIALKHKPAYVCIVPEKEKKSQLRADLTLKKKFKFLKKIIYKLKRNIKIRTSLFIEPNLKRIYLLVSSKLGAAGHDLVLKYFVKYKRKEFNNFN